MNASVRNAAFCAVITVLGMDAVPAHRSADPHVVLLQPGGAQTQSAARTPDALAQSVRALMASAERTGEERYYGYAEQALRGYAAERSPELQRLHAQLLQHRHDFAAAERQLSALLQQHPHDVNARLMRAQVRLHLQQPSLAMSDCVALLPRVAAVTATTCIAQARAAAGDVARAYALMIAALQAPAAQPEEASWSAGVAAELAARVGDGAAAEQWFRQALRLDPGSHFARVTYADWLLWRGEWRRAREVASAGASMADRTRLVLATRSSSSRVARSLQSSWREASARGERDHLRDLARFHWFVLKDARGAHALALDNFRDHRSAEDALLLAHTAAASHDEAAMLEVERWQRELRYHDVRLERLLRSVARA